MSLEVHSEIGRLRRVLIHRPGFEIDWMVPSMMEELLFDDILLPMEAFLTTRDTHEMRLVTEVFNFAKELAEMQLSEVALALYSAYILLQEGNINKSTFNHNIAYNILFFQTVASLTALRRRASSRAAC